MRAPTGAATTRSTTSGDAQPAHGPAAGGRSDLSARARGRRLVALIVDALRLARRTLRPGGAFVAKALQGEDHKRLLAAMRGFGAVSVHKPAASRKESAEVYVLAKAFDPRAFDATESALAALNC